MTEYGVTKLSLSSTKPIIFHNIIVDYSCLNPIFKVKGVKLFLILKGLSGHEIKELKKAVQSPLYNTNERLICLYEVLKKQHPIFPNTTTFKEKIFRRIFPTEAFNDQKLRRAFSQLREVTEQFLIHQQINKGNLLITNQTRELLKIS